MAGFGQVRPIAGSPHAYELASVYVMVGGNLSSTSQPHACLGGLKGHTSLWSAARVQRTWSGQPAHRQPGARLQGLSGEETGSGQVEALSWV